MSIRGRVRNGLVVPDEPAGLPEGAEVRIEVVSTTSTPLRARKGGQYSGQIQLSPDFDEWPADMRESLGMEQ